MLKRLTVLLALLTFIFPELSEASATKRSGHFSLMDRAATETDVPFSENGGNPVVVDAQVRARVNAAWSGVRR